MRIFRSLLSATFIATWSVSALAQGSITFANGSNGLVWQPDPNNPYPAEIPIPVGGGYVQLFWAPAGTPYNPWSPSMSGVAWYAANPGWKLESPVGFNTPLAGRFNGGNLILSPLAPGGMIDYAVIAWTGSALSMDAAFAQSDMVDVSKRFTSATGNAASIPPEAPVLLSQSFGGLHIVIPEPSVFALGGLGIASLLVFRRQK